MIGHGLVIDFEGSQRKGIREVGYISIKNFEILEAKEFTFKEKSSLDRFHSVFRVKYDFFLSHHASTEKNLLKQITPYPMKQYHGIWGPWLDTVSIYKKLYPNIENYTLENLTDIFVEKTALQRDILKFCDEKKRHFHNPLFDSLCCYRLTKRLKDVVNLEKFLF